MVTACMLHWYASMMFTVPTGVVGAWGWWSSRRIGRQAGEEPTEQAPPSPE
jgi:hypothetical protein